MKWLRVNATYAGIAGEIVLLVVLVVAGLTGGLILFATLSAPRTEEEIPPLLSEIAAAPEVIDPTKVPPIGLSPIPVDGYEAVGIPASAQMQRQGPSRSPSIQWADPYPASPFTLTDQDGLEVSLREFLGKVVLLNFIFTHCTTACPLVTAELKGVSEKLARRMGRDLVFLSVTIDPERDTPAALKRFGEKFSVDFRHWRFLTGSSAMLAAVLNAYHVAVEREAGNHAHDYQISHSNPLYLIDQWGRVRKRFAPTYLQLRGIETIEVLIRQGREDRVSE